MEPSHTADPIEHFCTLTKEVAQARGIEVILSPDSHIPYPSTGDLVNGYMIEYPKPQLAVATGKDTALWLPILVHESSHLDQYLEGDKTWKDSYVPGTTIETVEILTLWFEQKIELSTDQLDEYVWRSRDVELDCERRTVAKIKAFNLPIDTVSYTQKANSYIFFYTAMRETRSWYIPGKEPYNLPEVWSLCPTVFLDAGAYNTVPDELMVAYKKILA